MMRLLGELYNYRLVDSHVIFDTLHLILSLGYGTPEHLVLDPPDDSFRTRLVITLLETCGQFFDRGSSKRRLDRFLLYFQRYVLSKAAIPLDVEFDLQDLFADLRPKLVRFATYEEAHAAIEQVELEEQGGKPGGGGEGSTTTPGKAQKAGGEEGGTDQSPSSSALSRKPADGNNVSAAALPGSNAGQSTVAGGGLTTAGGAMSKTGADADSGSDDESGASFGGDDDEDDEKDGESGGEDVDERESREGDGDDDTRSGSGMSAGEESENVKLRKQPVVEIDPEEMEEFDREFRALVTESMAERRLEKRPGASLHMSIPLSLLETTGGIGKGRTEKEPWSPEGVFKGEKASDDSWKGGVGGGWGGGGGVSEKGRETSTDQPKQFQQVALKVLMKKGTKQQAKQLLVPSSSMLVQASRKTEQAAMEEKQDIKRRVLAAYNNDPRGADDDERSSSGQPPPPPSNRLPPSGPPGTPGVSARVRVPARGTPSWEDATGNKATTYARQRRPLAAGQGRRR
eukprot:TRINITY_DN8510_c0_g1_i1.p1 TRINITY_DN8510_c0_g1~~TRINITY_DN8510_c0_g1_i1.p1  ORF type:complete len:572 (+),score=153.24 TRINITY_DN8510_c0_g1_i1:177-1718(+)